MLSPPLGGPFSPPLWGKTAPRFSDSFAPLPATTLSIPRADADDAAVLSPEGSRRRGEGGASDGTAFVIALSLNDPCVVGGLLAFSLSPALMPVVVDDMDMRGLRMPLIWTSFSDDASDVVLLLTVFLLLLLPPTKAHPPPALAHAPVNSRHAR